MRESELYQALGALTKDKSRWAESVPYVSSLLSHESVKIRAKSLWLLGEIGLAYPQSVQDMVPVIVSFLDNPTPLLRERAVNALGRIGRGSFPLIEPYWTDLFRFASDEDAKVRLSFIWASENIATNTPDIYQDSMPVFEKLLHDKDDRVRMEAPEIFRVLGRRRPEFVRPFIEALQQVSETDENRVVRIHCLGAIKATVSRQNKKPPVKQAVTRNGKGWTAEGDFMTNVTLLPLNPEDREQFILDNQEAFHYGALEEFGRRDDHFEADGEIISRETIERSIDGGEAWRIWLDGKIVGGVVLHTNGDHGDLDLLFVSPKTHSKGIGYAAWCAMEQLHPEVRVWETVTPYFEKRNIHFYVNRCGFHIVEFFNSHHPDPNDPEASEQMDEQFPDGMFRFEKRMN